MPLVEQLLPRQELGSRSGFGSGIRADPVDLVVVVVDVRVQMVVAGHEGPMLTLSSTTVGCLSTPCESVHPSMVMRVVLYSLYPSELVSTTTFTIPPCSGSARPNPSPPRSCSARTAISARKSRIPCRTASLATRGWIHPRRSRIEREFLVGARVWLLALRIGERNLHVFAHFPFAERQRLDQGLVVVAGVPSPLSVSTYDLSYST